MKPYLILALLLPGLPLIHAGEDREFTSKTLKLSFGTSEEAGKWSLRGLAFEDWLAAVSDPGWTELYKGRTDDFYFAIYRSGRHLIFCKNDRKNAYNGGSTGIQEAGGRNHKPVHESPSKWTTLKWELSHPSGGLQGQETYTTWKIVDGFAGDIVLDHRVMNDTTPYRKGLTQVVPWSVKEKEKEKDEG